ncbi:hypothetical protein D3C85_1667840 [compost metagenome]
MDHAGFLNRFPHGEGLLFMHGERFLADDMLARLCRSYGDFSMHMIRSTDIYDINVIPFDQTPPIGLIG